MTTVAEVHAAVKALLTANFSTIDVRYKGDSTILPNEPPPMAFVEVIVDGTDIVAFGGGRGGNLQRSTGRIEASIMMPTGGGTIGYALGLGYAESIAAVFRGQRTSSPEVSYFAAEVFPESGHTEDGTMEHVATATVNLWFDKAA